jgi:hypothetical protein
VSKTIYKKFDQKSKTDFFSNFFLSRFWAFLDEGSSKTQLKKYRQNKSGPTPLSYSYPPTHHGGPRLFFFAGPLVYQLFSLQLSKHRPAAARCGIALFPPSCRSVNPTPRGSFRFRALDQIK